MRTSRLSKDTSRIIGALSTRKRPTRMNQPPSPRDNGPLIKEEDVKSDSELSSPPSSIENIDPDTETIQSVSKITHKRKRSPDAPAKSISTQTTTPKARNTRPKEEAFSDAEIAKSPKAKRARRQPAKKVKTESGTVKIEPPSNWEEVYNLTKEMRSKVLAPVDTMGCESLADTSRSPEDQRLQTLIALMLSSQTKDTVTAVAIKNLQDGLPGGFNLQALLDVEPERLNELIMKVGFHNNKTKYIKQVAPILRDKFNGDIPDTIEGMISLPGVGPKMAYLCMSAAWGRDEGIGVDVHVHRITNLWGWHKTKTPEETRASLEAWLPREKWHDINHLLVGFGQTICLPVGRKCGDCVLSNGLCPSAVVQKKLVKKVKREVKKEDEGVEVKEEVEEVVENIKAEDVEPEPQASEVVPDIEDIGRRPRRKPR